MKIKYYKSLSQLIRIITSIALTYSFANAQTGQLGFSSIITNNSSSGTITNATSTIIEDANKNWQTNSWAGYYINITNSDGTNQVRRIVSNTSKTITVTPSFTFTPTYNLKYVIRRGYKESTRELKLKLYMQYNDGNRNGGKLFGYSARIQASDTAAVEFVSVEQGTGLGKVWTPNYYAPQGKGQINWMVLPLSESQPLASGLYNIATITVNILKTNEDKPITFYVTNCPDGGLPIGSSEDRTYFSFDTTTNATFAGREEILVISSDSDSDYLFSMNEQGSKSNLFSYPNPFNPTTTIRYGLNEHSHVQLVIYDMLGRLVSEVVNQKQFEGLHSAAWEPNNLSSGTYFARLITQGSFSNQKEIKTLKLSYTK